jgi:hypothetical protein
MTIIITLIIGTFIGFYIYENSTNIQENPLKEGESNKAKSSTQERNESMQRIANNMNIPIDTIKEDFLNDLKKNNINASSKDEILKDVKIKKQEESNNFNISEQNTASAIIEEWFIEYFDDLIDESNEVENFITNNFEIFLKLKNNKKIEMNEFFDLSNFLEFEKTTKPSLGIDIKNNINMDMVLLGLALNDTKYKAGFFLDRARPIIKVDKKIILKIIDFSLKLEDIEYTPYFYALRSDCKKELNLYNEALNDINTAIQLISEIDWKKEIYYNNYIEKKSVIEQLLNKNCNRLYHE